MPSLVWGAAPVVAPVISGITETTVTATSVDIAWDVTPGSQGEVRYGLESGGPYNLVHARELNYLTHHVQRLSGLAESTTYYYVIWARDAAGTESLSDEGSYATSGTVSTDLPPLTTIVYTAQPALSRPGIRSVVTDPTRGTEVTAVGTGIDGQGQRYSCPMPWNCDESILFLDYPNLSGSGDTRPLLDGQTLEVTRATNSAIGNFRWHGTIPNQGFGYANPNIMRRYTVSPTGGFTVADTWTLTQYNAINYTGGQGRPSNDGRYHPITFKKSNGDWGFAIADWVTKTIEERVCGNSTAALGTLIDCSYMSWDGNYTIPMFEVDGAGTTQGTWAWARGALSGPGVRLSQNNSHADVGQMPDGTQVLVMASQPSSGSKPPGAISGSYVGVYRLDNGAWTSLFGNYPNAHIGTPNINLPDYAVLSNFSTSGTQPGFKEVGLVQLSTGLWRPFGHTHKGPLTDYPQQTQCSASPSGTRLIFRSDWDGGPTGCFVIGEDVIR